MVKDTKIIRDRADVSKGYGFVTFETSEEADRVRDQEDCLYLNGKKLNIGQAIRKQQICFPKDIHVPGPPGSWVMHPAGYASFTNSNGITYFAQSPVIAPLQQAQPYSHVMNYQPMATHYPGYAYSPAPCSGQAYGTVHLPWPTPVRQYLIYYTTTNICVFVMLCLALKSTVVYGVLQGIFERFEVQIANKKVIMFLWASSDKWASSDTLWASSDRFKTQFIQQNSSGYNDKTTTTSRYSPASNWLVQAHTA
uniref:deleted in azoospermia-like n=1 Tax=Ciona intestinalis TaxID=7719 RepID=UPI000EF54C3B|nr:deleted in azoospermia-like [Ciona intestinalis]|eukprot:XP_018672366.2 deleted in azoospermia-like [Ciona intestinalis]